MTDWWDCKKNVPSRTDLWLLKHRHPQTARQTLRLHKRRRARRPLLQWPLPAKSFLFLVVPPTDIPWESWRPGLCTCQASSRSPQPRSTPALLLPHPETNQTIRTALKMMHDTILLVDVLLTNKLILSSTKFSNIKDCRGSQSEQEQWRTAAFLGDHVESWSPARALKSVFSWE